MHRFSLLALFLLLPLAGCAESPEPKKAAMDTGKKADAVAKVEKSEEEEIKESLAELTPEDRKLAEEQKYCAVADTSRLGSMGAPVKIMVKEQPVFLCCGGCKKSVLKE